MLVVIYVYPVYCDTTPILLEQRFETMKDVFQYSEDVFEPETEISVFEEETQRLVYNGYMGRQGYWRHGCVEHASIF